MKVPATIAEHLKLTKEFFETHNWGTGSLRWKRRDTGEEMFCLLGGLAETAGIEIPIDSPELQNEVYQILEHEVPATCFLATRINHGSQPSAECYYTVYRFNDNIYYPSYERIAAFLDESIKAAEEQGV